MDGFNTKVQSFYVFWMPWLYLWNWAWSEQWLKGFLTIPVVPLVLVLHEAKHSSQTQLIPQPTTS